MATTEAASSHYVQRLDAARGLATLGVYYYHWLIGATGFTVPSWNGLFRSLENVPQTFWVQFPVYLWVRVPLFFVLSGFVIHCIGLKSLKKNGRFDVRGFLVRRFFRIYPAYFIAIVVLACLARKGNDPDVARQFLTHALLIHNFSWTTNFGLNPSFWTLASEVQFFLVYPLLLALRVKKGLKTAAGVVIAAHVVGSLFAASVQNWEKEISLTWWMSPLVSWLYWGLGAYLAERYDQKLPPLKRSPWILVALPLLLVSSNFVKPLAWSRYLIATILSLYFVDFLLHSRRPIAGWERLLMRIGTVSYSVYLWHTPIIARVEAVLHRLKEPLLSLGMPASLWIPLVMSLGAVICFAVVYLFSWLSYRTLEQPSIEFGKRLLARRQRAETQTIPVPADWSTGTPAAPGA